VARQRLTVQEAAEALGASVDAVRSRIRRGTLDHEKDPSGRVFVWLGDDQAADEPQRQVEGSPELVDALRAQVEDLKARLDRAEEAARENRRLLAAALERIPPQLEAPSSAEDEPEASAPTEPRHAPQEQASPWWRRIFGQ
jgi:hypothetical protein